MKMKKTFFLLLIILFPGISRGQVYIEDDFERYYREQKAAFNNYAQNEDKKFKAYYDSINQEFAKYLAEAWPDFSLKKKEPPIVKPVPPTVYKPDTPQPKPIINPIKEVPKPTIPDIPSKDEDSDKSIKKDISPKVPIGNTTNSLNMIFYGTPVAISKVNYSLPHLTGIDEQSVAKYWNALTKLPYTDWMAFTLRQKINTIKSNDIDPDVFSIEYGTDGFYNKVSIAWGGTELPERTFDDFDVNETIPGKIVNFTMNDILKNTRASEFINDTVNAGIDLVGGIISQETDGEITKTITQGLGGSLMLSEQYDALVAKYGELEKRVESAAPDYETAQYMVNALLIQYVRDYNYQCKCRALSDRKYIGGTFYAVENPFTKESELYYLNGYTIRTQKDEPIYHDLDFKYGPESAEEILDYQYLVGGASGTVESTSTEDQIWADAAKITYAHANSTQDPEEAWEMFGGKESESETDCYGMSAYLYYRFNNQANIPCRVVGDTSHHVVMLYKNNQWQETRDEYRALDQLFRWKTDQVTTVLLDAPNSPGSTSSGNTDPTNTNGGNRGD